MCSGYFVCVVDMLGMQWICCVCVVDMLCV